jgi:hypothetical protein
MYHIKKKQLHEFYILNFQKVISLFAVLMTQKISNTNPGIQILLKIQNSVIYLHIYFILLKVQWRSFQCLEAKHH